MKRYLPILTVLLLTGQFLRAQEPAATPDAVQTAAETAAAPLPQSDVALWEAGNTAYINGDFIRAAACYEALLERGSYSAKLYYNLANAYFKDDRLGPAILNYRRALRLSPGSEDIRHNLSVAESRTKDNIESVPEFFLTTWLRALRNTMSGTAWTVLSLAALAAMLVLILFYLLSQRLVLRKAGFYGTLLLLLVTVVSTLFALSERRAAIDRDQAVILSSAVSVKSSPDTASTDLFVLHEGTTVRITGRLGDWWEIVIADGKKGWLESRQAEVI